MRVLHPQSVPKRRPTRARRFQRREITQKEKPRAGGTDHPYLICVHVFLLTSIRNSHH